MKRAFSILILSLLAAAAAVLSPALVGAEETPAALPLTGHTLLISPTTLSANGSGSLATGGRRR